MPKECQDMIDAMLTLKCSVEAGKPEAMSAARYFLHQWVDRTTPTGMANLLLALAALVEALGSEAKPAMPSKQMPDYLKIYFPN